MKARHFLTLLDFSSAELESLLDRATRLKAAHRRGEVRESLKNRVMGMIFEKSSTRTRVSFEAGMAQLGGHALFLSPRDTQLGRGEPIEDSARVLSSMVDLVMIRTFEHERLTRFAEYSSVPVINALTDDYHPCQLLADMLTYRELRGSIQGRTVAWIGDGNNMCHSYILAAERFDFQLKIATPRGYEPKAELLDQFKSRVQCVESAAQAAEGSALIATDVWASMGQEEEQKAREKAFAGFQVTEELLDRAQDDVLFMHCLPAHRGEEISEDLLEDSRSVVWQEAENRLHAQKALMEMLLETHAS